MSVLVPGTRVHFRFEQWTQAKWFGTAAVLSYDSDREEYITERDAGSAILRISPVVQAWPSDHVVAAKYQLGVSPDLPEFVGPSVARAAADLGYEKGVHFTSSEFSCECC